jgi:hypothetical protein
MLHPAGYLLGPGLSPGQRFCLSRLDCRNLAAVRARDPVGLGGGEDGDEKQRELGGALLQVVVNELAAVLAGGQPSGQVVEDSLKAEKEEHCVAPFESG